MQSRKKIAIAVMGFLLLMVATTLLFFLPGKSKLKPVSTGEPVTAVAVKLLDVPVYIDALGTVTPTRSVTVVSQINGILSEVAFKEGQRVGKGQVIARIDDRALKAQWAQAKGVLAHDQAVLANAERDLARFRQLIKAGSISGQTLDTQLSTVRQQQGTVAADAGSLQNIQVQLSYCTLVSPVDGIVGLRQVDPGNYVTSGGTTAIAVITQMQPATVVFAVPEDDLGAITRAMYNGPLSVQVYDRDKHHLLASGRLLALDNQVDISTGTVRVKAQFEDSGQGLFPNQFVNARLQVDNLKQVPVVPTEAIQHGSKGDFVFVMQEHKAVLRNVKVGPVQGTRSAILDGGLKPGEQVITQGADKLDDGAPIRVIGP